MEDYLETVLSLLLERPVARVSEVAETLGVSEPTASAALKALARGGYVKHQSYGYVELTDSGQMAAERVAECHKLLTKFFEDVLGVESGKAAEDACQVEHCISKETLERLSKFVEFIYDSPRGGAEWLERFHSYYKTVGEESAKKGCAENRRESCVEEVKSKSLESGEPGATDTGAETQSSQPE
jgi:DtxR family Mn-dependent transcriptional regulator